MKRYLILGLILAMISISLVGYCAEPAKDAPVVPEIPRLEQLQAFQNQLLQERTRLQDALMRIDQQLIQNQGRILERQLAEDEATAASAEPSK